MEAAARRDTLSFERVFKRKTKRLAWSFFEREVEGTGSRRRGGQPLETMGTFSEGKVYHVTPLDDQERSGCHPRV